MIRQHIHTSLYIYIRRSFILPVMIILAWLSAAAGPVITFPRDRGSSVAVIVRDLADGNDIVSQNPGKAMLPASTMKCVTSAAAIIAGVDSTRFYTRVYLSGPINDGILDGDILIAGVGDPTTDSGQFAEAPGFVTGIAEAIKNRGIKEINGGIIIDSDSLPDSGPNGRWELADTRHDYGAGLYALNYRDNTIGSRAMPAPDETFGEALEKALADKGIPMLWDDTPQGDDTPVELIYTHSSPLCGDILDNMMKRSDNLFAESMLRKISPGSNLDDAITREKEIIATGLGIDLDIADIYDGSGLSRVNRLTADNLADILAAMASNPEYADRYIPLFPRAGVEGTVKSLLKGTSLEGKLVLKSGSMKGVHCYAGYKLDDDGKPTHVVVILVNDFFCRRDAVRNSIAGFLQRQFKDN